ncbi:MAG: sigma-54 dependent transcriptional regulator [Gammaproteobacteria bacterium]|jgi:DNA-binding NtrC family response regulator
MDAWNGRTRAAAPLTAASNSTCTRNSPARHSILLQLTEPENIPLAALNIDGWDIHPVDSEDRARHFIHRHDVRVGLAYIDNRFNRQQLDQISRTLSSHEAIRWIALLSRPCTQRDPVCDLIARHCYDYHTLPCDAGKLLLTLGHAWGMAGMQRARDHSRPEQDGDCGMIGNSKPMQRLYREIHKAAGSDAPVLLVGESGTGKELTAHAIHTLSRRSEKPYVAVNCAALPESLIQSELFGHEKGAFTGASQRRIGHLEAADGGSIFLDEISDMPLDLQVNLLRFLEIKMIERLGSTSEISVNARIIAATHTDLEGAVQHGLFREDLYYRLNVLQIRIPSLRERGADIELLADHVLHQYADDNANGVRGFSQAALQAMLRYRWPGNVRELINRVRRAMVMSERKLIAPADLGLDGGDDWRFPETLQESRIDASRKTIESALQRTRNNISQAARDLGVSRTTVYRLMEKFSIST